MSHCASPFVEIRASLADVVGESYVESVGAAWAYLSGDDAAALAAPARAAVDWYPAAFHARQVSLLPRVGSVVCAPLGGSAVGTTTDAFAAASSHALAPLAGFGFLRVGEDGCLRLITKSEHYHTPVGHAFPGYRLLETARRLGIPNATHNNTRGHITRLLEEELVAAANGVDVHDRHALAAVLDRRGRGLPNRVLNLETGSLAAEAGLKLMLARFLRVQPGVPEPVYHGRIPVFLVMGNDDGEVSANYHGTTVLTQVLRGMWPGLAAGSEQAGLFRVCPIRPNHVGDLEAAFRRWEEPPFKIAGFLHEIIMMNYGARQLEPGFLQRAYALCGRHDVPTLADEIQSCLWAPGLLLYREYGIEPNMVALGKGFPGGEYPASRLLFSADLDVLPQFGALVTNGQEEIASLAYLITMRWAMANRDVTRRIGDEYEARVRDLAARHPAAVAGVHGQRHLLGIAFHDLGQARAFTGSLNQAGLDISAQTYKPNCPPVALTKLPLTACRKVVDAVVERFATALRFAVASVAVLGTLAVAQEIPAVDNLLRGLPPATALLPADALGVPGVAGGGDLASFTPAAAPDAPGSGAVRVSVPRPTPNHWDVRLTWRLDSPVSPGDALLLAFRARPAEPGGTGEIRVVFRNVERPYNQALNETQSLAAGWTQYLFAFSPKDAKPAGGTQLSLSFGSAAQTVEVADVRLLSFGTGVTLDRLAGLCGAARGEPRENRVVGTPLEPGILAEMGAFAELPAVDPAFDPHGDWRHAYSIWTCHGYTRLGNKLPGSLVISRQRLDGGSRLQIVQNMANDGGMLHRTEATVLCAAHPLARPVIWELTSTFVGPDGQPVEGLRTVETGTVAARGALVVTRNGSESRRDLAREVTSDWCLFDAVQRLPRQASEPLVFDLLEGMSLLKEEHRLVWAGERRLARDGNERVFAVYQHTGAGILPYAYWLDAGGRLVLVVTHSRAYVLEPRAEERQAEYLQQQRARTQRRAEPAEKAEAE